ncbi:Cysteine desulfurase IscS [bacterium HR34]|nr:Cysteine desulfurase IscS [bacterium HR34]
MKKKIVYLDYASTTPLDKGVFLAMKKYFSDEFGNSMSVHTFGRNASVAIEESRYKIASFLNCRPNEIIFTGSATESNNFAIKGAALAYKDKGNHILISSLEHPSVYESAFFLKKLGFEVEVVKSTLDGIVDMDDLKRKIKKQTILVSVIFVNNEIGTIQPIKEIGQMCKSNGIIFHTDAVQAFGKIKIDVKDLNIDLLTASSHKIYGPKGCALLYKKEGVKLEPLLHGGGQENGLRSSTANTPAIVGFAKAVEICERRMEKDKKYIGKLRDLLEENILKKIKDTQINGARNKRIYNISNILFKGIDGETLMIGLDMKGICVSTGSACSVTKLEPSKTLLSIGLNKRDALSSIRFSLGRENTKSDITKVLKTLEKLTYNLRGRRI